MLKHSLDFQHRHLQPNVQKLIYIQHYKMDDQGLWEGARANATPPQVAAVTLNFAAANANLESPGAGPSILDGVRKHKYTLITCNTGEHWFAVILHATTAAGQTKIHQAVIAEPTREPGLNIFIWNRLRQIFTQARGFVFEQANPQAFWFPTQNDDNSCGFRVYETFKTVILRINDEYIRDPQGPLYNNSCKYHSILGRTISGLIQ